MLEITLTWVSGYRRSHRGRNNAPFIRSITHAPDQTYIRLQHLHCLFDLAISPPFWIIAWIETIFMEFRGPKALVNLHGSRQAGDYHLKRLPRAHQCCGTTARMALPSQLIAQTLITATSPRGEKGCCTLAALWAANGVFQCK